MIPPVTGADIVWTAALVVPVAWLYATGRGWRALLWGVLWVIVTVAAYVVVAAA